jgi:hypothetical protein
MNKADYEKALAAARRETAELLKQRTHIDRRLTELKATTEALSSLLGVPERPRLAEIIRVANEVPSDPGITRAIRLVLGHSSSPLTAGDIKAKLEGLGVGLSHYVNPSAVIHNTLSRLERQGEVMRVQSPGYGAAFALVPQLPPVPVPTFEPKLGVPNPLGRNLRDMLKDTKDK